MKKAWIITLVLTTSFVVAQQQPAQPKAGTPAAQQPAAQAPAAQGPTAATTGGKKPLQFKTKDEQDAYSALLKIQDAAQIETAANEFNVKYPESDMRGAAFQAVMNLYQAMNNGDKVVEFGRKTLKIEPENAVAGVMVATVLAERTRDTDLDKSERLNEARKDANMAIQNVDGISIPVGLPPERAAAAKATITSMAYAALGAADIADDNYPSAEQNLKKSAEVPGLEADPLTLLRLAIAQDHQGKYAEALATVQKALPVTQEPTIQNLLKQEQDRLTKLVAASKPKS